MKYRKIPIISPKLQYICSKCFFVGPIFREAKLGGAYYRRKWLIIGSRIVPVIFGKAYFWEDLLSEF